MIKTSWQEYLKAYFTKQIGDYEVQGDLVLTDESFTSHFETLEGVIDYLVDAVETDFTDYLDLAIEELI